LYRRNSNGLIAEEDHSARSSNEVCALNTSRSNEVQICTRCSREVSCLLYAEWWDALAWIASLRRWIAPYAAIARRPAELRIFRAFAREYRECLRSCAMCRMLLGKQQWSDLSIAGVVRAYRAVCRSACQCLFVLFLTLIQSFTRIARLHHYHSTV
jgi:hypothetical protein